jgi:uncharacterized protein YjeT (DUF2065 family)
MQRSLYLARLIGPVLVVIGFSALISPQSYRAMAYEFLHSYALIYISGLFALICGLALVLAHNVWVAGWPAIISVLGWLGIIGGVFRILAPQQVSALGTGMMSHPVLPIVSGLLVIAIGLTLSYFGYLEFFGGRVTRTRTRTRTRSRR